MIVSICCMHYIHVTPHMALISKWFILPSSIYQKYITVPLLCLLWTLQLHGPLMLKQEIKTLHGLLHRMVNFSILNRMEIKRLLGHRCGVVFIRSAYFAEIHNSLWRNEGTMLTRHTFKTSWAGKPVVPSILYVLYLANR